MTTILETERLIVRNWQPEDIEPFAAMNADPRVMEFFPATMSRAETETMMAVLNERRKKLGFCFWAVELKESGEFIGFTGLSVPRFETHFTPCVEIGWRLAHALWGHGYATEAAKSTLRYAFETLSLKEIVSFTAVGNLRSRKVMEKIGMQRNPREDFDHPKLPQGHPLQRHVLYRIANQ